MVVETFLVYANKVLRLLSATASYRNAIAVGLEPMVADLLREHTLKGNLKREFDSSR